MRNLYQKYPVLLSALLLILISFPDVILGHASLRLTDAVPFDGTSAYATASSLYPETNNNLAQGFFDAGGTIWQSESKAPYMRDVIRNGENPFWNPYQGAGALGSETLVDNKFSPITLLSAVLGASSLAYNFAIIFFLTFSTYFLIKCCTRFLELPLIAGIAAAMAFLFNGFQTSGLSANYTQSYLLFPICLYALFAWVKSGGLRYFIAAYLAGALILCLTFIPTTSLTLLTLAVLASAYALQQPYSNKQKIGRIVGIGAALIFGLLLVAVLYMPIALSLTQNKEMEIYTARVFYPITLNGLLSLFSPKHLWDSYVTMTFELIAEPGHPAFVGNNGLFHIGLTGGLLALFTFHKKLWQNPLLLVAWGLAALVLLRIFGIALYPHPENDAFIGNIFLRIILLAGVAAGLLSQRHQWKKAIFLPVWAIAALLVLRLLGFDFYSRFIDMLPGLGSFGIQYLWVVVMICLPLFLAFGMAALVENPQVMSRAKYFLGFIFILFLFILRNYPFNTIHKIHIHHLIAFTVICGAIAALYRVSKNPLHRRHLPILALLLLFAEYNYYLNHARPMRSGIYSDTPEYVDYIKQNIGNQRIVNIGQMGIPAEQASAYQVQDISTTTNSPPQDYVDFYLKYLIPKDHGFFHVLTFLQAKEKNPELNLKMLGFTGVKYIVVQKDWPVWNTWLAAHVSLAHSTPQVAVYENPEVWPRTFVTAEPLAKLIPESIENGKITKKNITTAEITDYHHDNLKILVDAPKAGTLVLTDNWYPYWYAHVNGKDVKISKVFGAFRGVAVPKGKSEITFYYKNPAVEYGLLVSGAALLITLGLSLIAFLRFRFDSKQRSAKNKAQQST